MNREEIKSFWNNNIFPNYLQSGGPPTLELLSKIRHRVEIARLQKILSSAPKGSLLDLGCGSGRNSLDLAKYYKKVVAVDFAKNQIKQLKSESSIQGVRNITAICMDILKLKLHDKFDVVFLSGVTQYLSVADLSKILNLIRKCSKKNTLVVSRDTLNLGPTCFNKSSKVGAIYRSRESFTLLLNKKGFINKGFVSAYFFIYDSFFKRLGLKRLPDIFLRPLLLLEPILIRFYLPIIKTRKFLLKTTFNPYHTFSTWQLRPHSF